MLMIGISDILGVVGGLFGGSKNDSATTSLNLEDAGALEKFSGQLTQEQLQGLQELLGAGPGAQDVQRATEGSRDFSSMLRTASETGFGSEQMEKLAGRQAQNFLAPQREQLSQTFEDEATRTAQLAAQLGRSVDDPILQAKLSTARLREEALLSSQEAGLKQQFGMQGLQLTGQAVNVDQALSQQAFNNRFNVLSAGQGVLGQQQQFRLSQASKTVTDNSGGFGGALTGALAGLGTAQKVQAGMQQNDFLSNLNRTLFPQQQTQAKTVAPTRAPTIAPTISLGGGSGIGQRYL